MRLHEVHVAAVRSLTAVVPVARVSALHRYPVKSMVGEAVGQLDLDERGCSGDRAWAVRTSAGKIGSGKTTRRFEAVSGLLDIRAAERGGRVAITLPDGTTYDVDEPAAAVRLSEHLGQRVTMVRETATSHFDDGPVSVLGTASVAAAGQAAGRDVDAARFRANIVLDTHEAFVEDAWVGRELSIGTAVLVVTMTSPRCVMVDAATADLPPSPGVLTAVGRANHAHLGVVARVVRPGRVVVGDEVSLRDASSSG